jgi:hypothetical protein
VTVAVLKVLIDENGDVLGTARADMTDVTGSGAPVSMSMVAGAGQRIMEVTVDDDIASYEPEALHRAIQSQQAEWRQSE